MKLSFEIMSQEILKSFQCQYSIKNALYNKLLDRKILFPESIEVWEMMANDLNLIFKLAREECGE